MNTVYIVSYTHTRTHSHTHMPASSSKERKVQLPAMLEQRAQGAAPREASLNVHVYVFTIHLL